MRFLILLATVCSLSAQPFSLTDQAFLSSSSTLKQGLSGYWSFEESSGAAIDWSGNANHLTRNNSVGSASGTLGNYATFTAASSQYFSIADNSTLHTAGYSFGVSCWVNLASSIDYAPLVSKGNDAGTDLEFYLFMHFGGSDKPRWLIKDNTASTISVTNGAAISLNAWHYVSGWYDGVLNQIAIQVDGGTVYTQPATHPTANTTQPLTVGHYADGLVYLNGKLDEVGFWKRSLTTTDLAKLYNTGNGIRYPFTHR